MKKVRVTKRMLEAYVQKLLTESGSAPLVIRRLSDILPAQIKQKADKRSRLHKTGVEHVPGIDDNTYVVFSNHLHNIMMTSLLDADQEQSTGHGHKFEHVAERFLNTLSDEMDLAGLNLAGNMPFADLLDKATNTLYTVKMSRSVGMGKLSGVGYRTIPDALEKGSTVNGATDFKLGYIKGKLDYSYIQSLGYIGLPLEIKVAAPGSGTREFSLSQDATGNKIYGIKGTFADDDTDPKGIKDLRVKLNKDNNPFLYRTDNAGANGYWSTNMEGPNPAPKKSEQVSSTIGFEEQFMGTSKTVTTYRVLLVGSSITPERHEQSGHLNFTQIMQDFLTPYKSGKVSRVLQRYINQNMALLDGALRSTVVGSTEGIESDKAKAASKEMVEYLLSEQEIIDNPYTGYSGYNMYAGLFKEDRGSKIVFRVAKIPTSISISSAREIDFYANALSSQKKPDAEFITKPRNIRSANDDHRARFATQMHYVDIVQQKAEALLNVIENSLPELTAEQDAVMDELRDLREQKKGEKDTFALAAQTRLIARAEAKARKLGIPEIMLEKSMLDLLRNIDTTNIQKASANEPLVVSMQFYDSLIRLYMTIKSSAKEGKLDGTMGVILQTLFPNKKINYANTIEDVTPETANIMSQDDQSKDMSSANQQNYAQGFSGEDPTHDNLNTNETRMYESILLDLMEASAKKQRAVKQPKKIKLTKRSLNKMLRESYHPDLHVSIRLVLFSFPTTLDDLHDELALDPYYGDNPYFYQDLKDEIEELMAAGHVVINDDQELRYIDF